MPEIVDMTYSPPDWGRWLAFIFWKLITVSIFFFFFNHHTRIRETIHRRVIRCIFFSKWAKTAHICGEKLAKISLALNSASKFARQEAHIVKSRTVFGRPWGPKFFRHRVYSNFRTLFKYEMDGGHCCVNYSFGTMVRRQPTLYIRREKINYGRASGGEFSTLKNYEIQRIKVRNAKFSGWCQL